MAKSCSFEIAPHVDASDPRTFSDLYQDSLRNVSEALSVFFESGEVTQGQIAWLDDGLEALWDIADILEVKIPRNILDTRVDLLRTINQ